MCKDKQKPQENPAISCSFLQELIKKHCDPKEEKHLPKYEYFIGLIYKGQKQQDSYVKVSNLLLRKVIRQPIITRLKDNLEAWGVIECNYHMRFERVKGKTIGIEPYSYRMKPDYYQLIQGYNYNRDAFSKKTNYPNPTVDNGSSMYNRDGFSEEKLSIYRDKFEAKVIKVHQDRWSDLVNLSQKPEYRFIRENALKLEIDPSVYQFINQQLNDKVKLKPAKSEFINQQGRRVVYLNKNRVFNEEIASLWRGYAEKIERGEFQFSCPGSTNRVYYNITSIASELRTFLRYKNEELYYLDYANFQPFLFNKLLNEKYPHDKPADVLRYIELTCEGRFYAEVKKLIEAEEIEITDHDNFKVDFFGRVFFSSEKRRYKYRIAFAKYFPNVSAIITEAKQVNYKDLSIQLQRLEAEIVINTILREIAIHKPEAFVLPVHDALITTKKMFAYVERLMLEKVEQIIGYKPTLKFEALTPRIN